MCVAPRPPPLLARLTAFLVLGAAGCATSSAARAPPAEEAALALADEYVAAFFARHPESATLMGFPAADHAGVTDNRPEALLAWHAREDALLARARALEGLAPGSPGWSAHAIVRERLEASVAMRACHVELWGVAAMGAYPDAHLGGGWQDTYSLVAGVQPVGTDALRRAAVLRLSRVPGFVDREIENLREGLRRGIASTRENVERVLASLDEMLASPAGSWPYLSPAQRDPSPELRAALERIVEEELRPATRRYRAFLAEEYLARARAAPGVSALPDGATCYRAAIRAGTTLDETPERLHALGRETLARIHAEMRAIAERSFGTSDVVALLARLRAAPEHRFASTDEMIARARAALARAAAALPRAFSRAPRCPPDVRPYPDAIASTGAPPSSVGSMSDRCYEGVYFVNGWEPARGSKLIDVSTAFHEAWPGHHLEAALKLEGDRGSPATRHLPNNAYGEGWALYSERLADELGLFESDLERLGMLGLQAFRAARLVADTGLHALGWTREQAAAVLAGAAGGNPAGYAAELDRYCAWPGQALGYMVGAIAIGDARAEAERALGARFDLVGFHDVVLAAPLPLPALRDEVRRWSAAGGAPPGAQR